MKKKDRLLIKKCLKRRIKVLRKQVNKAKSLKVTNGWIRFLPYEINIEKENLKIYSQKKSRVI